jgi:signal transduction histidine kinase
MVRSSATLGLLSVTGHPASLRGDTPAVDRVRVAILAFGLGIVTLFVTLEHVLLVPVPRPPLYVIVVFPLGSIVAQLLVTTVLASHLERRRVGVAWVAITTCVAGMIVSAVCALLSAVVRGAVSPRTTWVFVNGPLIGLQAYGLWVLAYRYPLLLVEARFRSLEMDRTRKAAELAHLREHLQPHFLRNTLNAIAALVTEDPSEARNLLAALGDLLSESLAESPRRTLGEEIAWLRRYAEIHEARYRGLIRFIWDDEPGTLETPVPRLLLQPLVENAIHHGALARGGAGEVTVRTRSREGGGIVVEVQDNGPGFGVGTRPPEGLGLRLVRSRVELEARGSFRLDSEPTGTCAVVELP